MPGGWAMVLCTRTWPSWWASAQVACPLGRPGGMRMRRAAQNVVPSPGLPSWRSTAKPSLRASQHRQSHRPGGASPSGAGKAGGSGTGWPVVWDRSQT